MDRIYDLFLMLGIHSTYLGSRYLHYAITLCLNNEDYLLCVRHRRIELRCKAVQCRALHPHGGHPLL